MGIMQTNPDSDAYPPKRGTGANAQSRPPEYQRRGQPTRDADRDESSRRDRPISEPTAPPRRMPPEVRPSDLPPRRGQPREEPDDAALDHPKRDKPIQEQVAPNRGSDSLPPRRGRPAQEPDDLESVEYPRRGQPTTDPAPPRRREPPDDGDDDLPPCRPARVPDQNPSLNRPRANLVPVKFDAGLMPLEDLRDLAPKSYNIFSNGSRKQEVELVLFKIKHALSDWAMWQEKLNDEK
jgi:hypothetical protein